MRPTSSLRRNRHWLVAVCWLLFAAQAGAGYTVVLLSGGLASKTVTAGETFDLDVVLASDAADRQDSAVFRLLFSVSGLELKDYTWSFPYQSGGEDDTSVPAQNVLPVKLTAASAAGGALPLAAVDLYLSNVASGAETYGAGSVLRLMLSVPSTYVGPEVVEISVADSEFAHGFTVIPAAASAFQLQIKPATGSVSSLLAIERSGASLILRWPAALTNVVLETTVDPAAADWIALATVPELIAGSHVVTVAPELASPPTFFRLRFR